MRKQLYKPILGCLGLIVVAIMTVIAFFIPTEEAAAADTMVMSDQLKVIVYDQFPSVKINGPSTGDDISSSPMMVDVFYENIDYIDFIATYTDEDGNPVEIPLSRFTPDDLDPEFSIASGEESVAVDLSALNHVYRDYVLSVISHSPIGYDEDAIEFFYVPAKTENTDYEEESRDPIIDVEYDDGVEKIEVMAYDEQGNALFDEPVSVSLNAPYVTGSTKVTLPFSSYGIKSGNYTVGFKAYKHIPAVDGEGNPIIDGDGNPITVLSQIDAPSFRYSISYEAPEAPAIPDTGHVTSTLDIAKSDILITSIMIMVAAVTVSIYIINRASRKKNYRKNIRRK